MKESKTSTSEKEGFFKTYLKCFHMSTKDIASNAIIAALYVALTYAFYFISYGPFQCRISEFLMLLCFFNPNYAIGLTVGCALSNIYSITSGFLGPLDIVFGSLATLSACLLMPMARSLFLSSLLPCLTNGLVLSLEFTFILGPTDGLSKGVYFGVQFGWIFLGEFIAISVLGYVLFLFLTRKVTGFYQVMNAKLNTDYRF